MIIHYFSRNKNRGPSGESSTQQVYKKVPFSHGASLEVKYSLNGGSISGLGLLFITNCQTIKMSYACCIL